MERVGLEIMDCTEKQADWRADKVEKSKPGAERLRSRAERLGCSGGTGTEAELEL